MLRFRYVSFLVLATALLLSRAILAADGEHSLILFPNFTGIYNTQKPSPILAEKELKGVVDIFYTYSNGRFRALAEYLLSNREHELERAQLSWLLTDNTTLSFGRMHEAGGYWNTAHHHGRYLQTSASRPAIEEFEDDGGVLPAHISGMTLQTNHMFANGSGLQAAFSLGVAPRLGHKQLEPFNLLDPDTRHGLGANGRVVFLPDFLGESQIGLLLGFANINVDSDAIAYRAVANSWGTQLTEVDQFKVGAYIDWHWNRSRVLSTVLHIINTMEGNSNRHEDFTSGYIQGEYLVAPKWTVFGRVEKTFNGKNSDYLARLPLFYSSHYLAGLRFDFAKNQALTVEMGETDTYIHQSGQFLLQWSASFP